MLYTNHFIQSLQHQAPDTLALQKDGTSILLKELLEESQQLATQLYHLGVRENDRIVIACKPGVDFLKITYATMMLRAVVAIIDPEMGRDNYRAKLEQFRPTWAFVDARLLLLQEHPILRVFYFWLKKNGPYFPKQKELKIIATGPWMPLFQSHFKLKKLLQSTLPLLPLQTTSKPHDYIVTYTSGTINEPKGVLHSFDSLGRSIELIIDILKNEQSPVIATHLPHFMLIGVTAKIPVHIWNYKSSALEKLDFIEKHRISILFGPPADYLDLIKASEQSGRKLPNGLQHILLGSAPIHVPFLEKLVQYTPSHVRITCMYGMTENLLVSTTDGRAKIAYPCAGDLLGTPAPGVAIRIAEDDEICLRSEQLFSRYWHMEQRADWHKTGDLGYLDENLKIVLTGRKKDMIIRRNFNLYPALYEPTVKKIENIEEAVLIGRYNENIADEEVILVLESPVQLDVKQIEKALQQGEFSIDKEAWPDRIIQMDIPRSGRQRKVNRNALRQLLKESNK